MNCIFHSSRYLTEDLNTLPMDWYEPDVSCSEEVGGDFYDFFFVDEDHIALVIADVSWKGMRDR